MIGALLHRMRCPQEAAARETWKAGLTEAEQDLVKVVESWQTAKLWKKQIVFPKHVQQALTSTAAVTGVVVKLLQDWLKDLCTVETQLLLHRNTTVDFSGQPAQRKVQATPDVFLHTACCTVRLLWFTLVFLAVCMGAPVVTAAAVLDD